MMRKFKYIVLILIICIIAAFLLSSSIFQISRINVNGNKNVAAEEIVRLSSIHYGQNIFRINVKKSMRGIFQNPYIKMIKIRRTIPNTITIDVIEREAIAIVPFVGSFLNIDEDGMIVKISTAIDKPDLPVINGLQFETFKIGEPLNIEDKTQLEVTVNVVREMKKASVIDKIIEVDVADIYNIKLKTDSDIKVNMGDDRELGEKMSFAKSIIEDLEKNNLKGTIEMSHNGNPIFKPEEQQEVQ
ncbi:MAG: cell division protein FtsQ/DivIB [Bacillota bacterium]